MLKLERVAARRELAQLAREVEAQNGCHHKCVAAIYGFWRSFEQPTPELYIVRAPSKLGHGLHVRRIGIAFA